MRPIKIHCYRHPEWQTNCYLVHVDKGHQAVLIDAGAPPRFFAAPMEQGRLEVISILLTHRDHDHVDNLDAWKRECNPQIIASNNASLTPCTIAELRVTAIPSPGHCDDHLIFLINDHYLFTGDLLFKGSVGGTANGDYEELERSLKKVMQLPPEIEIYPGHAASTTLATELSHNPFLKYIKGELPAKMSTITLSNGEASILVEAKDYDGDRKLLVQYRANGKKSVVPA